MSVTDDDSEEIFIGAASDTYAYGKNTDAAANVKVARLDEDGVPTDLVLGTNYDLANVGVVGSGITVTYPNATSPAPHNLNLTSAEKLVVWIEPPFTNSFNPKNTASYDPVALGNRMDKLIRLTQKLKTDVGRCYHVALGATGPAASPTGPTVAGGRVLLDEHIVTAAAKATVTAVNWPATYDSVEMELIGMLAGSAGGQLEIEPLDGLAAIGTSLVSAGYGLNGATIYDDQDVTNWKTPVTTTIGVAAGDELNGLIRWTYFSEGDLVGQGNAAWKSGGTYRNATLIFHRTGAPATSWDGFDVKCVVTTTGIVRLWGIVRS